MEKIKEIKSSVPGFRFGLTNRVGPGSGGRYIIKIEKDAYKLELVVEINILPTFNVKDLRPYHG